ncbi:MAG TPA: cupin domain-containing protein [Sphingomonadaceae bacterium]|nr:cupin domain-containing protein [Sphingomonadaceae bacterium]
MTDYRRVVTGHDKAGRPVLLFDGKAENVVSQRPLQERCLLWTTNSLPANIDEDDDAAAREDVGIGLDGGSVFGIVTLQPGLAPKPHRSDTIDYIVILSGRIAMELDENSRIELGPHDTLVQRGTIHNWVVEGPEPCVMAVSMISAVPPAALTARGAGA